MNEVFLIGNVIEKGDFKFILKKSKHKSQIEIKVKLLDGNIITAIAYDKQADYVLRKKLKLVNIYGELKGKDTYNMKVKILRIQNL